MSQKAKINLKIIIGSTRQNRFSEHPASWLYEKAKKLFNQLSWWAKALKTARENK